MTTWTPPGPGPWMQDRAHNPVALTAIAQELVPASFTKGFADGFAEYGVLLDTLALGLVNGFSYHQPQPFDMPGPDGPKDPAWIGAEIGRRTALAAAAFEGRIWREGLRQWDDEVKPAALARHRSLGAVDLRELDDAGLQAHIHDCADHVRAMVHQHHRFNVHALAAVGDFALHAAGWTHRPPMSFLKLLDGYSPVSNVSPPEMQAALAALRADDVALAMLNGDGEPATVLAALRARLPEVEEYVSGIHFRLMEGFDVAGPTLGEQPACIVGRMRAALDVDADAGRRRADAAAADVRSTVPAEHQAEFDELLAEARLVYRLRDERGIYSDISASGLLRLGLLELGRRLLDRGRVKEETDVLDVTLAEVDALVASAPTPTAAELHARGIERLQLSLAGAPRFLGDPPPPPPPVELLPPPLARVMSAVGFLIDGILGELDEPRGDATTVGGIPGADGVYEGPARLVLEIDDLLDLEPGEILVAPTTGEAFNSMLHLVGAIVTDHGSFASHAAIVSREMGIPAVVGTVDGTARIATGRRLRVDGTTGTVTLL